MKFYSTWSSNCPNPNIPNIENVALMLVELLKSGVRVDVIIYRFISIFNNEKNRIYLDFGFAIEIDIDLY